MRGGKVWQGEPVGRRNRNGRTGARAAEDDKTSISEQTDQRVGLLPQGVADVDPILRWFIELRVQLIEEAACGPQASGTGAPGMEEGRERILRSLGMDWKADEQAIVDHMRAEVRKWWQNFPERQLTASAVASSVVVQEPTHGRSVGGL